MLSKLFQKVYKIEEASKAMSLFPTWSPPMRGGNSISINRIPSAMAASTAGLASLRKLACTSMDFEIDFSKGEIPSGSRDVFALREEEVVVVANVVNEVIVFVKECCFCVWLKGEKECDGMIL